MEENIIGRIEEKRKIMEYVNSQKSELVAIYGRRRVGKTFLVKELLENRFSFSFTGIYNESKAVQLHQFSIALQRYFNKDFGPFSTWFDAFDCLRDSLLKLNKEQVIVFLDELPWMDTRKSGFISAFSSFWNNWDNGKTKLKLFVCGSATTWMLDKFIGNKGGLYGRVTKTIYLSPFTLSETEEYLTKCKNMILSRIQVIDIYMILGGIPYYLDMLDNSIPVNANIDRLFFCKDAPLRYEFNFLFRSLFNDSDLYISIIRILSRKLKGMTRQEIIEEGNITNNGFLTEALNNLISCDFIEKYASIGKKEHDVLYRLTDPFSLFYLRFVNYSNGQDENFWSNSYLSAEVNSWKGYAFENVCFCHIKQIKKTLGISGILSNVYGWSCKASEDKDGTKWPGGQIDLLIDRKDNVINIAEIKYSSDEYIITSEYAEKLRKRTELFRHITKTKKALHTIFITTYGVKRNNNYGLVQHDLTAEDLFT